MRRNAFLVLAVVVGALWFGGCSSLPMERSVEPDRLVFVQITDPQVGMYRAFKEVEDYSPELRDFGRAVELVKEIAPDFVVITGDLVEQWNDEEQIALFKEFAAELGRHTTVYLTAGNHDMSFNPEGLAFYREQYGPDRYTIVQGDTHLIAINSNLFAYPAELRREEQEQFEWMERELAAARAAGARHIFVMQHHPLFLETADEEDAYFNIPSAMRARYLDLLTRHGVAAVFSGHYHREAGGFHDGLEMIVTSSLGYPLGDTPPGMRVVTVDAGGYRHEYVPLP